jgi:hypothetical protein
MRTTTHPARTRGLPSRQRPDVSSPVCSSTHNRYSYIHVSSMAVYTTIDSLSLAGWSGRAVLLTSVVNIAHRLAL